MKALAATLGLIFAAAAFGDAKSDARAASRHVLEISLDRAAGSPTQQDWKATADWGLQAAQAAWEKGGAAWNEDPAVLASDRQALGDALAADVTQAWQAWLVNRFYQRVGMDTLSLSQAAAQADRQWLYQTDADGNIVYDAAGNPVVLVKTGSADDANDTAWQAALTGSRQALLGSWDQTVQAALPELLAYPEADQVQMGELASRLGALYRDRYKRELDALYLQQVSRYASTRLYDRFSLKKKSADDTAGTIVDQLIRDVRTGTDSGIKAVQAGLALDATAVSADAQVNAAQWQASFRQVLEAGLSKWDIAEKQLLAQRAAWETQAGASYQSGEAAWAAAYGKLTQERTSWQGQLRQILAEGQAQWAGKQAELSQSIAAAASELDEQLAQRQTSRQQQVGGLVDVYTQSQNLVQTAQTSGEYWFNRMVDPHNLGTSKVYSWTDMNSWASARIDVMRTTLQTELNTLNSTISSLDNTIGHAESYARQRSQADPYPSNSAVRYTTKTVTTTIYHSSGPPTYSTSTVVTDWNFVWRDIVTKNVTVLKARLAEYKAHRTDLNGKIASLAPIQSGLSTQVMITANETTLLNIENYLNSSNEDAKNSWESYNEGAYWLLKRTAYQAAADSAKSQLTQGLQAVMGSGGNPQDILNSTDLESGYIDEYQVALLKAQVQQQYWEREYQIAQQVYAYATDTSSSRPTEAQQKDAWNQALAEYQVKKNAYAAAVAALQADGQTVAQRQAAVEAAQAAMDAARTALQAAQAAYSVAIAARASNRNTSFYDKQIGSYEQDLEKLYGLDGTVTDTLATRLVAYRAALRNFEYAQELSGVQAQLKSLVQGVPVSDMGVGTPSLESLQQAAAALLDPTGAVAVSGSIPVSSTYGAAAAAAQTAWQTASGAAKELAGAQFEAYYRVYSNEVTTGLKQRQAQIALLVAASGEEWYRAQTGRTSLDVPASLLADSRRAEGRLLQARLKLAADAWGALAGGQPATAQGKTFASLIASQDNPSQAEAAAWTSAVNSLLTTGDSQDWWTDPQARRPAISAALGAVSDPLLRDALKAYLAGSSGVVLSSGGGDASLLLVSAERGVFEQANLLASVWDQGSEASEATITLRQAAALNDWRDFLDRQNWSAAAGIDAEALERSVTAWAGTGTLESSVAEAVARIRAIEPGLRADLGDAARTLVSALLNLAALKGQASGSTDVADAQAQAAAAYAAAGSLTALLANAQSTQSLSPSADLLRLSDLAGWARATSTVDAALQQKLDAALTGVLASAVVQARVASSAPDPWADALASASAGLDVPSVVSAAALSQAQALYAHFQSGLSKLTDLAADPTSALLGTVTVDSAHLGLAENVWTWTGLSQEEKIDAWRQGPGASSAVEHLFASWDGADTAGRAGLQTVMQGLPDHLEAGKTAWSWFQTTLGGVLASLSDAAYADQQAQIDGYVGGLTDLSQRAWTSQLFASLQTEADNRRSDFSEVLADVFSDTPNARVAEAWTLLQAPAGSLNGLLASTDPSNNGAHAVLMSAFADAQSTAADGTYVAALLQALVQTVDDGGDVRETLLAATVSGWHNALAAARGAGPLSALRERALAVTLASQTTQEQYGFLQSLTALESHGSIAASVYGSGRAFDETYSGFVSTQSDVDLVLGWYLEARAASGLPADASLLSRLSTSARSEVAAFRAVQSAADVYVGLGQDAAAYARESGTADVLGAIAGGGWESDFWLASMAAQGADTASMAAQVQAWRQISLELLLPDLSGYLLGALAAARDAAAQADVAVEFRQSVSAWKARIASGEGGFRSYLKGLKDASGESLETVLKLDTVGGGLPAQAEYELELAAEAWNAAVAENAETAVLTDFVSRYAKFAQGTASWNEEDSYHVPDAILNAFSLASENLNQTRGQLAADQAQIVKLGQIRALVANPPNDTETAAKAAAIQNALAAYTAAESSLDAAMQSLAAGMTAYNQRYQASNQAYDAAEDARYAFEAQDQILTYSQNGYLSASDPTLQLAGYQSPSQLLATATTMRTRARTVLDTLSSVTPSQANANDGVSAQDAAYRSATGDLLSLTALQDQLAAQIARQDAVTKVYGQTYQEAVREIISLTPAALRDEAMVWSPYLVADENAGLRLNFNLTSFVLGERNSAQNEEWGDYTADPETYDEFEAGSFSDNAQRWLASMQAWQKTNASNYQDTMKTWGLAYDYLLFQIKKNNSGIEGLDKLLEATGTKDLNLDSNSSLDEFLIGANSDLMRDIQGKSGNNNYTYLDSYRDWMRTQLQSAWNAVKADTAHWQLFQNALALRLTGGLKETGYFDYAAKQKAFEYIRDKAQNKSDNHFRSARVYGAIAADYAFAFNFSGAAVYGGLALDERQKGTQQKNGANAAKASYNGYQTLIEQHGLVRSDLNDEAAAWTNYSQNWNLLQSQKGAKAGATEIAAAELVQSLTAAMTARHTTLSAADRALVERQFGLLSVADKTDSVTALAAIIRLTQSQQKKAQQDLGSRFAALKTQFEADEAVYRDLENRYLAGDATVTQAQLKTQALATYGSPVYTALVQAQKQMAEDSGLVAAATTPLSGHEIQKASLVARIASTIGQLEAVRLAHLREVRVNEWAVRQQELATGQQRWQNQVNATVVKAQQAWSESFSKLNTGYKSWQASFAQEYQAKAAAWADTYQGFQWSRRQWVDAVATNANQAQNEVWAIGAGQAVDAAISRSALTLIGDMAAGMVSADGIVSQITGGSGLDSYLKGAQRLNGSLAAGTSVRQGLKFDVGTVNALAAIQVIQNQRNDDLEKHAALIVAAQVRDNIALAQESYTQQVADANEGVDAQMDQTFLSSGYGKTNGHYTRRAIIGSTLGGNLYERQNVDTYQAFTNYDFSVQTSLDDASLTGLDAFAVEDRVDTAMTELQDKAEAIFGKEGEEETKVAFTINKSGPNNYTDTDGEGEETKARDVEKITGTGLFGRHLGYAPEMKSDPRLDTDDLAAGYKASVLIPGTGETGRLIGWYQYFSMRASKGWAEQNQPFYSQKLYDDRNSWIKAPTLKDVAMTGVAIAATLATGGAGAGLIGALSAAAITTGADALFTLADVAHGADEGQAWGAFGKRAAITGVTTAVTMGMSGVSTYVNGLEGFAGTVAKTGYAAGMAVANKGIASTVNAIHWENGHIGFSGEAFASPWDPSNAANYASIAMAATSAGVSSYVNQGGFGFLGEKLNSYNQVGNMFGSLASAGVSYAMTGDAAFNVANLSMFGLKNNDNQAASMGLLELHIGDNGSSMNLGQGGADISYQAWQAFGNGLQIWDENRAINARAAQIQASGVRTDLSVGIRSLASNIDAQSSALYDSIMDGTTTFREDQKLNAIAQTVANGDGTNTITLGGQSLGGGLNLSVLLAHEAGRNGLWDGTAGQLRETRDAAMNHMNMAMAIQANYGSSGLNRQLVGEANIYAAYKAGNLTEEALNTSIGKSYSSEADFWKLTKDGKFEFDGRKDLYADDGDSDDSNDVVIRNLGKVGIEGGLLKILGLADTDENRAKVARMMLASGMEMGTDGMWIGKNSSVRRRAEFGGNAGSYVKNGVNLTESNMGKSISLRQINDLFGSVGASKDTYTKFIENNFGSAYHYRKLTKNQTSDEAVRIYDRAYTSTEQKRIDTNIRWYDNALQNGVDVRSMVPGARPTQGFGVNEGDLKLKSSEVPGAEFFNEDHTGFDYAEGEEVRTPGGVWKFIRGDEHKAYFQLVGTDLRMRIQHLKPADVSSIALAQLFGQSEDPTRITNWPEASYGAGTGSHVHVDFTRNLPYQGSYVRQFVSPNLLVPGRQLEYAYSYKDAQKNVMSSYSGNYNRF